MKGGRAPDKVWRYASANPDADEAKSRPYVDIFKGKSHIDNATKFKVWLAFDCPEFRDTKAREWCELVAGLTEKNVSQRKDSDAVVLDDDDDVIRSASDGDDDSESGS